MGTRDRKARPSTQELFVEWLKQQALPNLAEVSEWPKGVTKYSYFWSEAVWPSRVLAKATLPPEELRAHRNGDNEAIFRFAQQNRNALAQRWVIRQLIAWRLQNTRESEALFQRFMRAYWSRRGKRRADTTMLDAIKKDIAIYADSLTLSRGTRTSGLAERHTVSIGRVKDVLKYYKKASERWSRSKDARLWISINAHKKPAQHR